MTELPSGDPILAARVDALAQNLQRVTETLQLVDRLSTGTTLISTELRRKVAWQVEQSVTNSSKELGRLRQIIVNGASDEVLVEAWSLYQRVADSSRELFIGCLELIGGCAFRQSLSGDDPAREELKVWALADRLIVEASVDLTGSSGEAPYFTVPALQEALSKSLVRTVRMRFPEWTVWTLPLLAYDYGHVAINDYRISLTDVVEDPLRQVLEAQVTNDLVHDVEHQAKLTAAASDEARGRVIRRADKCARDRIGVLLADALATHWMGPAYACAAVHLRFDPSSAFAGRPSYDERVRLILGRLRRIARKDEQQAKVAEKLTAEWIAAVERADAPRPESSEPTSSEELLVSALDLALSELPQAFRFGNALWSKANSAKASWEEEAEDLRALTVPAEKLPLRVVLNAAWLTRLAESPGVQVRELASITVASCEERAVT